MKTIKEPADILKLKIEDLVELYVGTRDQQDELEAQRQAVKVEIMERLTKEKVDGKQVGDWAVTKFKMITFKTSLEDARKYGATKTEEKPDTTILRKLYNKGEKIPGAEEREELRVSLIEKEELETK